MRINYPKEFALDLISIIPGVNFIVGGTEMAIGKIQQKTHQAQYENVKSNINQTFNKKIEQIDTSKIKEKLDSRVVRHITLDDLKPKNMADLELTSKLINSSTLDKLINEVKTTDKITKKRLNIIRGEINKELKLKNPLLKHKIKDLTNLHLEGVSDSASAEVKLLVKIRHLVEILKNSQLGLEEEIEKLETAKESLEQTGKSLRQMNKLKGMDIDAEEKVLREKFGKINFEKIKDELSQIPNSGVLPEDIDLTELSINKMKEGLKKIDLLVKIMEENNSGLDDEIEKLKTVKDALKQMIKLKTYQEINKVDAEAQELMDMDEEALRLRDEIVSDRDRFTSGVVKLFPVIGPIFSLVGHSFSLYGKIKHK